MKASKFSLVCSCVILSAWAVMQGCADPAGKEAGGSEASRMEEAEAELPDSLYFWEHIAPIAVQRCTPCHHEGGAGPFPLQAYSDFARRLKTVHLAIADGFMPPWPADPNYSRFKNEKVLKPYEKQALLAWIKQGGKEGRVDSSTAHLLQSFPQSVSHAQADYIASFPDTVHIEAGRGDRFYYAKIPFELERDTFISAFSFKPGNRQLVHHVNGHLINYEEGQKSDLYAGSWLEDAEVRSSIHAYRDMNIANDDGSFPSLRVSAFNYLPGVEAQLYPPGLGSMRLAKKGVLLLNTLHYGPSAVDTFDLSEVHFHFAEKAPERPLLELHLGTQGISAVKPTFIIPAGEVKRFETRYRLEEDISVLTVNPHMHLLGKSFRAFATSPDKADTIPLIHIPEWDFRWQYFYTYPQILPIPKGYEVVVEAVFDNSINNPHNPNSPPKTMQAAGANMKTTDEMFQFFLNYLSYREGDENISL